MDKDSYCQTLFQYSLEPHRQRHAPRGYTDYQSYKPWLRDEYCFRCVYCLCRERWFPDGDASFSVDHHQPQTTTPDQVNVYENLVYSCCYCNSAKREIEHIADVGLEGYGKHLEVLPDGTIRALTVVGKDLIGICRLNRQSLVEFRRRMIALCHLLGQSSDSKLKMLWIQYFGFPDNVPPLSTLRPPGGNDRPEGVTECWFAKLQQGELPEVM